MCFVETSVITTCEGNFAILTLNYKLFIDIQNLDGMVIGNDVYLNNKEY